MYNCITIVQLYSLLGDAVHTWKSRRRVFLKMSVSDWVERVFKFYMCVGMYFPCFLCVCLRARVWVCVVFGLVVFFVGLSVSLGTFLVCRVYHSI